MVSWVASTSIQLIVSGDCSNWLIIFVLMLSLLVVSVCGKVTERKRVYLNHWSSFPRFSMLFALCYSKPFVIAVREFRFGHYSVVYPCFIHFWRFGFVQTLLCNCCWMEPGHKPASNEELFDPPFSYLQKADFSCVIQTISFGAALWNLCESGVDGGRHVLVHRLGCCVRGKLKCIAVSKCRSNFVGGMNRAESQESETNCREFRSSWSCFVLHLARELGVPHHH